MQALVGGGGKPDCVDVCVSGVRGRRGGGGGSRSQFVYVLPTLQQSGQGP